jgi:hypothetical protein
MSQALGITRLSDVLCLLITSTLPTFACIVIVRSQAPYPCGNCLARFTSQPRSPLDTPLSDASMLQAWTDVLESMPDAVFIVAGKGNAGRISYLNSQPTRI